MSKRRKFNSDIGVKSDIHNGQVLVLPPELLQKLGISLGNIIHESKNIEDQDGSTQSNCDNGTSIAISACDDMHDKPKTEENCTSIMKIANLMKDSVLLSPSFSTNFNVIEPDVKNIHMNKAVNNETIEMQDIEQTAVISTIESNVIKETMCDKHIESNSYDNILINTNSNKEILNNVNEDY
ncbi:unnamed protein product, partial [Leptidea sinapis]